MSALKKVFDAVDREQDRFVEDLRRLVRQPSVSSQNIGVRDCAELLVTMLSEVGATGRVIDTDWHPVVYGEIASPLPGAPTLVIYNHYDVQPADPVELWSHPPFEAKVVDGVMYGRGTTDAKGNLVSHLKAIDAFRSANMPLPCNIKFLFDGEEESGSPSLPAFVDKHLDLLRADAALSFDGGFDANDKPRIQFGTSGLLFVELRVRGAKEDLHSARARIVENPAWRLLWLLNKLKTPDGRVHLPGFYNDIRPVTDVDRKVLADCGFNDEVQKKAFGIDRFLGDVSGLAAFEQWLFTPTCNIAGFASGFMGEGRKTVLPAHAACRLDFRLVADQNPNAILANLRTFLDENGCADFEIISKGAVEPARTAVDSPFAKLIVEAANSLYPQGPSVMPTADASGRQAVWLAGRLGGIPAGGTGMGPPNWRGHAPDEFMIVDYFVKGIKYSATILAMFGERFRNAT